MDFSVEDSKDLRSKFIAMLREYKFHYRSCLICDRQLFYFIMQTSKFKEDERLYFSLNCDCVKYYVPPEERPMSDIDYLINAHREMVRFYVDFGPEMEPYFDIF